MLRDPPGRYEKEGLAHPQGRQQVLGECGHRRDSATMPARLIGFAKVTRDITERREAQRELEQAQNRCSNQQKIEALGRLTGRPGA